MKNNRGILVVVSGFSGAGKGTLMKKLMETYSNYSLSISKTSRLPRDGEVDTRDYFFTAKEVFEQEIGEDGFVEHACYCGNYYGTPKKYVEEQLSKGQDVILEIEIQGALKIKEKFPRALLLFVMPPNATELEKRLRGRGTETEEQIKARIKRAAEEADGIEQYEYIVVNDNLEECVKELHSIIQNAKNASNRNLEFIETIRKEIVDISKGE
ncbi:MAG: guanylate kinase [Eubacteriales bacterium]